MSLICSPLATDYVIILPETTSTEEETPKISNFSEGFYPIINKTIKHYTKNDDKSLAWYNANKIREFSLIESSSDEMISPDQYLTSSFSKTACHFTSEIIFSIFAENCIGSNETFIQQISDSMRFIKLDLPKGVDQLRSAIQATLNDRGDKGLACLCWLSFGTSRIHQFVLEIAPNGNLYIYQSYFEKYTLDEELERTKAASWNIDSFLKDLLMVTNSEDSIEEKLNAYERLFAVDPMSEGPLLGWLIALELTFIPLHYNKDSATDAVYEKPWNPNFKKILVASLCALGTLGTGFICGLLSRKGS